MTTASVVPSHGTHRRRRSAGRGTRRSIAALLTGASALAGASLAPGTAAADPLPPNCTQVVSTVTCTYGPGAASFTAPAGVTSFSVTAAGASGGTAVATGSVPGLRGDGGAGTELVGSVRTGANRDYQVAVGGYGGTLDGGSGHGSGGQGGRTSAFVGGGGGGGTSLSQAGTVVLVAGGGGGGGGSDLFGPRQNGQGPGLTVTPPSPDGGQGATGVDPLGSSSADSVGGGGGGGLVGGAGGAPGQGGSAGTSTTTGFTATPAPFGAGSLVISYEVPAPAPVPQGKADLSVGIDGPSSLGVGQAGTVTVTVTNRGVGEADRVRTLVALPSTLRAVGPAATTRFDEVTLAPGASATYTLTVVGRRTAAAKQAVVASTSSRTPDASLRDNTAFRYITVAPGAGPR